MLLASKGGFEGELEMVMAQGVHAIMGHLVDCVVAACHTIVVEQVACHVVAIVINHATIVIIGSLQTAQSIVGVCDVMHIILASLGQADELQRVVVRVESARRPRQVAMSGTIADFQQVGPGWLRVMAIWRVLLLALL